MISRKNSINKANVDFYVGSDYSGNYVWSIAIHLTWNELNENVLHDKLRFKTTDKTVCDVMDKMNHVIKQQCDIF